MDTILFDLDGTLLPIDMDVFIKAYFKELCKKLSPFIVPEELSKIILTSTEYMIRNREENKTNMEAFFEDFEKRIDKDINHLIPVFEDFYRNDFKKLGKIVRPNPLVKEIIRLLKQKGYDMVIATNPLFPREAIHHRIEWAGLNKDDFIFITTYENMHFCKPNAEYYAEILNIINKEPEDVIMVGNDVQEDMVASQLNIKTFLIEDYLIDRKEPVYNPDFRGTIRDFYEYVHRLPALNSESDIY